MGHTVVNTRDEPYSWSIQPRRQQWGRALRIYTKRKLLYIMKENKASNVLIAVISAHTNM